MTTPFECGATIHQHDEFMKKLASGKPLRVKYGIDPTAASIHLGHLVGLLKLRQFQQHGHRVVLIIGNSTAMVGDPTGRDNTRPRMTNEEVDRNANQYLNQIKKIIEFDKAEIYYNRDWFSLFKFEDVISLLSRATVQQILTRDDFDKRVNANKPIFMHECLYPLLQAYDSVRVNADVEIGGQEQLFNFMLARELQRKMAHEPQVCLTLPILRGLDGNRRMGKSLGNYIGLDETPFEMYSKVMSIPDHLLQEWWTLLPVNDHKWIGLMEEAPMLTKKALATRITCFLHDKIAADCASEMWHKRFTLKQDPENMPTFNAQDNSLWICRLLVEGGLAKSKSDARRLIVSGAVTIGTDRTKILDPRAMIDISEEVIVRVGNRKSVKVHQS